MARTTSPLPSRVANSLIALPLVLLFVLAAGCGDGSKGDGSNRRNGSSDGDGKSSRSTDRSGDQGQPIDVASLITPQQVAEAYYRAVIDKDHATQLALLTEQFRENRTELDAKRKEKGRLQPILDAQSQRYAKLTLMEKSVGAAQAKFYVTTEGHENPKHYDILSLVNENGKWRIAGVALMAP